jgi:hypothetical protein
MLHAEQAMNNDDAATRRQRSALTPRQERAAERIYEDESLTASLSDDPARALVAWAVAQVVAAAARPDLDDARLSAYGKAVRSAVRSAARAGQRSQHALVARAEEELARLIGPPLAPDVAPAPASNVAAEGACAAAVPQQSAPLAPPPRPGPLSWEERWRRWLRKER